MIILRNPNRVFLSNNCHHSTGSHRREAFSKDLVNLCNSFERGSLLYGSFEIEIFPDSLDRFLAAIEPLDAISFFFVDT